MYTLIDQHSYSLFTLIYPYIFREKEKISLYRGAASRMVHRGMVSPPMKNYKEKAKNYKTKT